MSEDFPTEIADNVKEFFRSLGEAKDVINELNAVNSSNLQQVSSLDRAYLNLTYGYALNSMFWNYLITTGVKPSTHGVKQELDLYKSYMTKLLELTRKKCEPKLDKPAATRFIRGALWELEEKKKQVSGQANKQGKRSKASSERDVSKNDEDDSNSLKGPSRKKRMAAKDFF